MQDAIHFALAAAPDWGYNQNSHESAFIGQNSHGKVQRWTLKIGRYFASSAREQALKLDIKIFTRLPSSLEEALAMSRQAIELLESAASRCDVNAWSGFPSDHPLD